MNDTVVDLPGARIKMSVAIEILDLAKLPCLLISSIHFASSLPPLSAVYILTDAAANPLYVGRAVDLRARWRTKFSPLSRHIEWDQSHAMLRTALAQQLWLRWIEVQKKHLAAIEQALLSQLSPPLNFCCVYQ